MSRRRADAPLDGVVGSLTRAQLVEVVCDAAARHEDVSRTVRLVAARATNDPGILRKEVDRAFRTRRFLDYRDSMEWARAARPVLAELDRAVQDATREFVELLERAVGHVIKVIHHADDSAGLIGELARELLDLHARACDAGVADPVKLAAWMIRFRFADQDFFEVDPVRYAGALGELGLAAYREAVDAADDESCFAVRYARERLAVLDRDIEKIVELLGGDLSNTYQFFRVAEAMAQLDRDDLVLEWTARGIKETGGWQIGSLYDLACETHIRLGEQVEVVRLRRAHHERMPSSSTYAALRRDAEEIDAWEVERAAARVVLKDRDLRGYIDALLGDADIRLAWKAALAAPAEELDPNQWLRLAEARESEHPREALSVYQAVAEEVLQTADRRAYQTGVRILKKAARAAEAGGRHENFIEHIAHLRETYRRRPTLIAMLDNAGFR